jgi:hypothetical protein
MKIKNLLFSLLAGGSLALGGGLVYKKRKKRVEAVRSDREKMKRIVVLALERLAALSEKGRVSASEVYFFIWVVGRVANRQAVDFPSFDFTVKRGMLISSKLTSILRKMLKEKSLRLDKNHLIPLQGMDQAESERVLKPLDKIAMIIEETAAQWTRDFPEEQLVRFSQLFK